MRQRSSVHTENDSCPEILFAPAVSGVKGIHRQIHNGDTVVVDGREGHVLVKPDPEVESGAFWSADGRQIYFNKFDGATPSQHRIAADGSGEPVAIALAEEEGVLIGRSTDGKIKAWGVGPIGPLFVDPFFMEPVVTPFGGRQKVIIVIDGNTPGCCRCANDRY